MINDVVVRIRCYAATQSVPEFSFGSWASGITRHLETETRTVPFLVVPVEARLRNVPLSAVRRSIRAKADNPGIGHDQARRAIAINISARVENLTETGR